MNWLLNTLTTGTPLWATLLMLVMAVIGQIIQHRIAKKASATKDKELKVLKDILQVHEVEQQRKHEQHQREHEILRYRFEEYWKTSSDEERKALALAALEDLDSDLEGPPWAREALFRKWVQIGKIPID